MFGSKKTATKKVTKAANPVKKAASQAQKQVKKVAKQAPKPPSPQKAKKAVKQTPRPVKKAASQASSAAKSVQKKATKATKGWVGGAGGPKDLDKWYGELPPVQCPRFFVCVRFSAGQSATLLATAPTESARSHCSCSSQCDRCVRQDCAGQHHITAWLMSRRTCARWSIQRGAQRPGCSCTVVAASLCSCRRSLAVHV